MIHWELVVPRQLKRCSRLPPCLFQSSRRVMARGFWWITPREGEEEGMLAQNRQKRLVLRNLHRPRGVMFETVKKIT